MTPYQAESSGKQLAAPTPAPKAAVATEETPEPTKRESKKTVVEPTAKKDLSSVVKAWSNEE